MNTAYANSLDQLLLTSDEEAVDLVALWEQLPSYAKVTVEQAYWRGDCKILDVGAGAGRRTLSVFKELWQLGTKIHLDSVEPRIEQVTRLAQTYLEEGMDYCGNIFVNRFEDMELSKQYDLLFFFHSIYQFERDAEGCLPSLAKLPDLMNEQGTGLILMEEPGSFLQRLKNTFWDEFKGNYPYVTVEGVEKSLNSVGIPYQHGKSSLVTWELPCTLSDEELGERFEFVFTDHIHDCPLHQEQYAQLGSWVRQEALEVDDKLLFETKDAFLWFNPAHSHKYNS